MRPGHNYAITYANRRTRAYGATIREMLDAQWLNQVTAGLSGTVTSSCGHNTLSSILPDAEAAQINAELVGEEALHALFRSIWNPT
jgi:hypothetical protein